MNTLDQIKQSIEEHWNEFIEQLPMLLLALIVLVLALIISRWITTLFQRRLSKRLDDQLLSNFLSKILRAVLIVLSLLLALDILGFSNIAAGLLAGAGVGAIIIGLAFQEIGANFIAGVILAFNRPFSIGDTIEIGGNMGKVLTLNLRSTHIKTFDGKDIYIPNNNMVKDELVNYTRDGFIRLSFVLGIDTIYNYESAVEQIQKATEEHPQVLQTAQRKPQIIIKDIGVSTVDLEIRFWVETFDYKEGTAQIRSEVIHSAVKNLTNAAIGLPAEIVELKHVKGDEIPVRISSSDQKEN